MLVFAALTPHSPLLLPSINRERLKEVTATREAMKQLAEELYAVRPDTLVILSSHVTMHEDTFSINLHDPYNINLNEFGDLSEYRTFHPDLGLIDHLQRTMRQKAIPTTLNTDETLHYSTSVPLLLLTEYLPNVVIVPISYAGLSPKEHFTAGEILKEAIADSTRRIAIIASGDQSHAITSDSPAGFAKEGLQYDMQVQEFIKNNNPAGLLQMKPKLVQKARECSYRSLLMLLGVLDKTNYWTKIHSYEAPFGVGYLVAHFEIG
ncbi:MAG: AmmeMemoRadiSam system protein B [Patescibacteria group bacterium]